MSPEVASSSPAMIRKSVDLPQPEGPTKTQNSPSSTVRSTPLITSVLPKDLVTDFSSSAPMRPSQFDRLAAADAFVGGKADGKRLHGIFHVPRQVQVLGDRSGHEGLLAFAQHLMAGFVGHVQVLVRLPDPMDPQQRGLRM